MRPAVRKKVVKAKPAITDARKELVKLRRWVKEALSEVKIAREYLAKAFAGPEQEALEWAQRLLENALLGKEVPVKQ